jgi:hypothetical protein
MWDSNSRQAKPAYSGAVAVRCVKNISAPRSNRTPGGPETEFDAPPPCPASLYGLSLVRRLCSPWAADWYIARPNVFSAHSFARLTPDDHQVFVDATDDRVEAIPAIDRVPAGNAVR